MLEPSKYYHIYNHIHGFEDSFNEKFFLKKYPFYILLVANTLAYWPMLNRFHFYIKIKSQEELRGWLVVTSQKFADKGSQKTLEKFGVENREWKTFEKFEAKKIITQQFSKLTSCYTPSFNKVYNQRGSLLVSNYQQKENTSEKYLKQVFIYIYNNPVKHAFVRKPDKWNFSLYNARIFDKESFVIKNHILTYFDWVKWLKPAHLDNLLIPNNFMLKT